MQAQQPRTHRPESARLHKGAKPRDKQRHAHQVRHFAFQPQYAADDQGGRDDADKTRQHMLQRGKNRGGEVRAVFEAVHEVGFIARAGGLSVRQNDGSGQKMEAQDARKCQAPEV